jgi:hypothetical protein
MSKRQANTLMAIGVAIILMQIFCTVLVLGDQERTRKEAEAAQVSSMDVLEMQKRIVAEENPDAAALVDTRIQLSRTTAELREAEAKLAETQEKLGET